MLPGDIGSNVKSRVGEARPAGYKSRTFDDNSHYSDLQMGEPHP